MPYPRALEKELLRLFRTRRGRITVLAGARQVGKTTLVRHLFPNVPLLRFDSAAERQAYGALTPAEWSARYPVAILDEVQKAPELFETLKSCYDESEEVRYILLGSSQMLLLAGVRETLAGRAALLRLSPFTLPEMEPHWEASRVAENAPGFAGEEAWLAEDVPVSPWQELLQDPSPSTIDGFVESLCDPLARISAREAQARAAWDHYLAWGGMPFLLDAHLNDADRLGWLKDYWELYLQRDLADLARLSDLEPFARAQKVAALRTGQLLQYASLATAAGISPTTAKRYMEYLTLSFQVRLLPPWCRNEEKRLARTPKLHFVDPGVRRGILGRVGELDGAEFESAAVSECIKQAEAVQSRADFFHLRVVEGREIDLLVELEEGYVAVEFKQAERVRPADGRHLRGLADLLDKPLLLGLVVSQDPTAVRLPSPDGVPLLAVPAWRLLG